MRGGRDDRLDEEDEGVAEVDAWRATNGKAGTVDRRDRFDSGFRRVVIVLLLVQYGGCRSNFFG